MKIHSSARRKWNVLSNYLGIRVLYVLLLFLIKYGNRTEWSPIRPVIIRVIYKIRRPLSGSTICRLITSMITDRIGQKEVLLPINHNYDKICDVLALLKIMVNLQLYISISEK